MPAIQSLAVLWYARLSGHMVGDDPSWPMMSDYPLRLQRLQKCTEIGNGPASHFGAEAAHFDSLVAPSTPQ